MKDRKEYREKNRKLFDDKEPLAGHIKRFEALLNTQADIQEAEKKPAKRVKLISLISIAASIAIFIGVAIRFYAPQSFEVVPPTESSIATDEFRATNDYYSQQMEEQIADIMCKLADTDTENQAQLTCDIEKIMSSNTAFVDEMAKNENQGMAIRYLVKHYKTNMQKLESINAKLGKYAKC
jgi:hypothetical protein